MEYIDKRRCMHHNREAVKFQLVAASKLLSTQLCNRSWYHNFGSIHRNVKRDLLYSTDRWRCKAAIVWIKTIRQFCLWNGCGIS